ncbi:hypothetical protein [Entomohabitans teleogrylli]|uniref:hypothetical protein n=1 Tax=Entomohabitans teleogrylli TaxID=1384589 RepID=UPI000B0B06CD|nr:hypothetical protein [Entomohabitans teleogrylli]
MGERNDAIFVAQYDAIADAQQENESIVGGFFDRQIARPGIVAGGLFPKQAL